MKTVKSLLLILVALLALGLATIYSGVISVAADEPHSALTHSLIETARERSISRRLSEIEVPDLSSDVQIRSGAGNYAAMCASCHLAPGIGATELSTGMYPAPPNLSEVGAKNPARTFWVIKHGIKASGMPAWGVSMEDQYIWNMVAFIARLPDLDAEAYAQWVASSDGHAHGGGETHDHHRDHTEGPANSEPAHDHSSHDHRDQGDKKAKSRVEHHDDSGSPPHKH